MVLEAPRFGRLIRSRLDRPQEHRQAFVAELLGQFEKHKALLEKLNAMEWMQQLAIQIRDKGYFAKVLETPTPQIATEEVRYNGWSTASQDLRYCVGVEWAKDKSSKRHVYEVVGIAYDSSEVVSFGHQKDEKRGYNPLSAKGMSVDEFGDHLIANFLLGTAARDVF